MAWNKDRAAEWLKEHWRSYFARKQILLIRHIHGEREAWLQRVTKVKTERKSLLSHGDICQIISAVRATERVPGELAELGVAYGASARIIAEYGAGRTLHLFDTFEGLPEPGPFDSPRFCKGSYGCSIESVRQYVTGFPVEFHPGWFPATAAAVEERAFAFVHLDADLYASTLEGLKFFYPRMSRGGIILSHDYPSSEGVVKAFDEFFAGKPEPVVGLSGYQCLVVKV